MTTPTGIEAEVCADIAQRQRDGIVKYGVTVEDNPLPLIDWLRHVYGETLDKAVYLKRAIREMEKASKTAPPYPVTDNPKEDAFYARAEAEAEQVARLAIDRWKKGRSK